MQLVSLDEKATMSAERFRDQLALDAALDELARIEPRKNCVVALRYSGGLSIAEAADVLKVTPTTVSRDWRWAKAWLFKTVTQNK